MVLEQGSTRQFLQSEYWDTYSMYTFYDLNQDDEWENANF